MRKLFLDGALAQQKLIHGGVAVRVHVDGAVDPASLPKGAVRPAMRQGQLAPGEDQAADDHGERGLGPLFGRTRENVGVQGLFNYGRCVLCHTYKH